MSILKLLSSGGDVFLILILLMKILAVMAVIIKLIKKVRCQFLKKGGKVESCFLNNTHHKHFQ